MNDYAWFSLKSIAVATAVAVACFVTRSGWPLIGLIAMPIWKGGREWFPGD